MTLDDMMLRSIGNQSCIFTSIKKLSKWTGLSHSSVHYDVTSKLKSNFSQKPRVVPYNKNYLTFDELCALRKDQAGRSIVVQVNAVDSSNELHAYCENFGTVDRMHYYTLNDGKKFFVVEFKNLSGARAAIESASHVSDEDIIPVSTTMMWFKNGKMKGKNAITFNAKLVTVNEPFSPRAPEINDKINQCETISEQMIEFYDLWKLPDICTRLRFLTTNQLEQSFMSLFPRIQVSPFGSSVNGFGRRGCDLDIAIILENRMADISNRFIFHAKSTPIDSRLRAKKIMETLAEVMEKFIPGVSKVRRILNARVPIIKYDQQLTGLECDLSTTNQTAVYMSELLFFYGEVDYRVRPLVFTIREWAANMHLTNPSPGRWITNFSLTLLVIFYLQTKNILPSLNNLRQLAEKDDVRVADRLVDCTFLRDVRKLPVQEHPHNYENLESLLKGFFDFYSAFNFKINAISLREGSSVPKPDFSPFYICNPLETSLNVSKNISVEETERLKLMTRNSSWYMETLSQNKDKKFTILTLFMLKEYMEKYPINIKRNLNLADLFKVQEDKRNVDRTMKNKSSGKIR